MDDAQALQLLGATEPQRNVSTSFSASEDEALEAARAAWVGLKRTFEGWIAIGQGIRILRRRADQLGGRKTFQRLMAEEGFRIDGPKAERQFDKTTATRLLKVMEQETEVKIWHQQLTPVQQADWASPNAILRHCPIFAKPKQTRPSPYKQLEQAHMALLKEHEQLKQQGTEHLFDPEHTTDQQIAETMIGRLSGWRGRARRVARRMLEILDQEQSKKDERETQQ